MQEHFRKRGEAAANESRAIEAGAVNQHCTVEAETISKYGRNPKSHTSRGNILVYCVLLFAFCGFGNKALGQVPYAKQKSQIYYVWQNDTWVQDSKVERVYDAKGNRTSQIEYRWQNNAWIEHSKEEYTYDAMGNLILHKVYTWQNNTWIEHNKYEYTYDIRCYKKNAFGLDLGLGYGFGMYQQYRFENVYDTRIYKALPFSLGFRYMHHFNHYFGADFVKINLAATAGWGTTLQLMTGVRGNTPTFGKCMSGYGALRLGYGLGFIHPATSGACFETELGVNLTHTFFMGMSYNFHSFDYRRQAVELRLGFNFGKWF